MSSVSPDGPSRTYWLWASLPVPTPGRSLACMFLGEALHSLDCPCPAKWLRACAVHGRCTIEQCKSCPDYLEG